MRRLAVTTGFLCASLTSGIVAFADAGPPASKPSGAAGGIPCYRGVSLDYDRPGKPSLKVQMGEPVVVAVASRPEKWGFFQFPGITRWEDGTLCASWSMAADSIVSYGSGASGAAVSNDGGKTWGPLRGPRGVSGLLLPNGDRITVTTPKARKIEDLKLPKAAGAAIPSYGKTGPLLYRLTELPPELRVVCLNRLAKGAKSWAPEQAALDDPQALRYSTQGLFPIVWWGDVRVAADGSVIAGIYPGYRLRDDGSVDPKGGVFFYRSTDNGHSWRIQGRIPYQPDLTADPPAHRRGGYTEPAFEILADGSFLCVMRTTDGVGIGPMYASRSSDLGKTWTKPEVIARSGVLPRLLRLENGVVVLSSGRQGVQLRFCTDGKGKTWTDPFEMLPYKDDKDEVSCGYTHLLAAGPDRFLLIYSDFRYTNEAGEVRKAIKVREVTVTPADRYVLDYDSPVDPPLQAKLEKIDASLRERFGMTTEQTAVGVLDLAGPRVRLAMIRPDRIEYAASVAKIGILLAYFQLNPNAATNLDAVTQHELGLMAKASDNEMASKFSHQLGLKAIQRVLDEQHFYDKDHGGGIWVGKHYGKGTERYTDPVGDNSHAVTVRQVLRFFLLLEQGKLVSPEASKKMREIFASPEIPHDGIKFVKGLAGRDVQIIRKWGTWEDWRHDAAVVTGPGRHYILVALTKHPKGDDYLVELAKAVDDLMQQGR